jgi:hypothetical protein
MDKRIREFLVPGPVAFVLIPTLMARLEIFYLLPYLNNLLPHSLFFLNGQKGKFGYLLKVQSQGICFLGNLQLLGIPGDFMPLSFFCRPGWLHPFREIQERFFDPLTNIVF